MESKLKLSADCMACMVQRQLENLKDGVPEVTKTEYMKEVFRIIMEAGNDEPAPVPTERICELHEKYFGTSFSFNELKVQYNKKMLQYEDDIRGKIRQADDNIAAALKYARVGNYIDFGAMGSVSDEKLEKLLASALDEELDTNEYELFKKEINEAKSLVYLPDNCGEIVLDKLLIEEIRKSYPDIQVTVIVRGKPILNDATMEDAESVGLTKMVDVIGNGTAVAGTWLRTISAEARDRIEKADIIISKGQGNFETLNGCGMNVYYLFLCKCNWFVRMFGLKRFTGVFANDRRLG